MEEFDKKLAQYGILAKNGKQDIKDNKITILDAEIKEINFQKLQAEGIKEICISGSEIKYLYFLEKNTIKIDFKVCNFKNQIIARKAYFENEVIFQQCVFDAVVDFSKTKFDSRIDFLATVFKGEVRFIETQFQAEQSNNETIENIFEEVVFEERASFDNAIFKARVSFRISQFKNETIFTNTKFQAKQNDSDIIENQFLRVVFIGKTFFNHATFKARVSFRISQFKKEVMFIKTQFLAEQNNSKIIENEFREVIFEGRASFFNATFKARVSFRISQFKEEVRFIETQFLAEQNNSKIIENEFREVIFEGRASFFNATFKARVSFRISQFKEEVRFIETQFLAEQNNSKIIENEFREVIFEGRASFFNATFKARVSFRISQFKSETIFTNTKFQANQNDSDIIENQFLRVVFIGKTIFNNATFKARVSFRISQFKEEVRFTRAQFLAEKDNNKIIENDFRETIFEREVSFDNVIFQTGISFAFSQFKNEVRLSINNFLYAKNINFIDIVFGKLVLQKELFEKSVNFKRCIFLQDVNFKDYTFNEIAFNTCTFKESAYFNNSNFTKGVDFHECEFEKTACFYGVKFDETPNFSQALFKGNINIINSNLNFDFTKLDKKIRLLSSQGEGKYNYEIANDFRDSFRNFKSALIKDNNLLDASNFHKYELYCKEIELKNKKDKTLKDKIDKWQLFFYRKLCDHHTDLLLNLRWLVVAIGLFALLYFASRVIQDINLLKVLNQYGVCLSIIGVFNLFCLYWFECIKKFDFFVYLNLIVVLWVVCYKPKIIFGIVNIIGGKSYNGFENALITIYTILLTLVLFSLQKTARKNSIVPS